MALSFSSAAAKWSNNLGHYVATGEVYQEAAVYRNNEGVYLYRYSDGTWRADVKIGSFGVYKSVDILSHLKPFSTMFFQLFKRNFLGVPPKEVEKTWSKMA